MQIKIKANIYAIFFGAFFLVPNCSNGQIKIIDTIIFSGDINDSFKISILQSNKLIATK